MDINNKQTTPADFRQCTKTVMDNIADPNIIFDEDGVCNYYHEYFIKYNEKVRNGEEGKRIFNESIKLINVHGVGYKLAL